MLFSEEELWGKKRGTKGQTPQEASSIRALIPSTREKSERPNHPLKAPPLSIFTLTTPGCPGGPSNRGSCLPLLLSLCSETLGSLALTLVAASRVWPVGSTAGRDTWRSPFMSLQTTPPLAASQTVASSTACPSRAPLLCPAEHLLMLKPRICLLRESPSAALLPSEVMELQLLSVPDFSPRSLAYWDLGDQFTQNKFTLCLKKTEVVFSFLHQILLSKQPGRWVENLVVV